jgi:hypothetical protein
MEQIPRQLLHIGGSMRAKFIARENRQDCSARCFGHEYADRQIRKDARAQAILDANMATAVFRFSDHRSTEINIFTPDDVSIVIAQFGARHRFAIVVVAAVMRIPRMCLRGSDANEHHRGRDRPCFH